MLIGGAEEAVVPNGFLHLLDEDSGRLVPSADTDQRLYRYSLVWLGAHEAADEALAGVLRGLAPPMGMERAWCWAWTRTVSGGTGTRAEWLRRQWVRCFPR